MIPHPSLIHRILSCSFSFFIQCSLSSHRPTLHCSPSFSFLPLPQASSLSCSLHVIFHFCVLFIIIPLLIYFLAILHISSFFLSSLCSCHHLSMAIYMFPLSVPLCSFIFSSDITILSANPQSIHLPACMIFGINSSSLWLYNALVHTVHLIPIQALERSPVATSAVIIIFIVIIGWTTSAVIILWNRTSEPKNTITLKPEE